MEGEKYYNDHCADGEVSWRVVMSSKLEPYLTMSQRPGHPGTMWSPSHVNVLFSEGRLDANSRQSATT